MPDDFVLIASMSNDIEVVDTDTDEVELIIPAYSPGSRDLESVRFRFDCMDALHQWLDSKCVNAVERYRAAKENTPLRVIRRAMEGTFRDTDVLAETILEELVKAGHLPAEELGRPTADIAVPGWAFELPEEEGAGWRHPLTSRHWDFNAHDVRDSNQDVWVWAGGFETDVRGVYWPLLNRKDYRAVDVRWDHVETGGWLRPVAKK